MNSCIKLVFSTDLNNGGNGSNWTHHFCFSIFVNGLWTVPQLWTTKVLWYTICHSGGTDSKAYFLHLCPGFLLKWRVVNASKSKNLVNETRSHLSLHRNDCASPLEERVLWAACFISCFHPWCKHTGSRGPMYSMRGSGNNSYWSRAELYNLACNDQMSLFLSQRFSFKNCNRNAEMTVGLGGQH